MRRTKIRPISHPGSYRSQGMIKTSALLDLKQAVLKENYEACANLIAIAREFGATRKEIENLLEDPRRAPD
jgi:hypothetical protein